MKMKWIDRNIKTSKSEKERVREKETEGETERKKYIEINGGVRQIDGQTE